MRFSFNWLKKYLATSLSLEQITDKLTSVGLEVEEVLDPAVIFKNFKLVRIQKTEKHPNADKLQICSVIDAEGSELQIVCGAPNAREGLIAVLALPGALIPGSNEILKKSKIRGVESQGMMCSFDELGIKSDEQNHGIIEVPEGTLLTANIGDVLDFDGGIIDVSITPNRGDCFSVKGIARDLAAAGAGRFIDEVEDIRVTSDFPFPLRISVANDSSISEYAPMMSFRVIKGIKNAESPLWLKSMLNAAGLNSISAVVDLSNFCMFDIGTPFQIYDLDKIQGEMKVRFAERNEHFVDFNDKEYRLQPEMLISEDERHEPLCLLGIKSGNKITCDENTKNILIESAVFDPAAISRSGIALDVTSDSRTRFERGVDRCNRVNSLEKISKLIVDVCGGQCSEIFTLNNHRFKSPIVKLTQKKLRSVSGVDVSWDRAIDILVKLGLRLVLESIDTAEFVIPSWRYDLNIEEDLIEEVLRIDGYDNVKEIPLVSLPISEDKLLQKFSKKLDLRKLLAAKNMSEVITYSFTKKEYADLFKEDDKLIHLINAISSDFSVMRPSLIPNMVLTALRSLNYGDKSVSIFEVGNVFTDKCEQLEHITGIRAGNSSSRNWLNKQRKFDIFDVKRDMFAVLSFYGIKENGVKIEKNVPTYYHPSRSGVVYIGRKLIGYFGELHPKVAKVFGLSERINCFEIIMSSIDGGKIKKKQFTDRVFPKIERDFAFVFNTSDVAGVIVNEIYKLDDRISNVDIFDAFKMNSTQKSIGVTVILDAVNRTLTESEANEVSDKIIKCVASLGGKLRN
ncbi:MAG: phenylalanine--tRNA ligase subunit beta [Alphaproteobacteria bacterium]|nr:phenylalanine--tRNA ligase subunit beta [Alphaproteobacteria bacterium]